MGLWEKAKKAAKRATKDVGRAAGKAVNDAGRAAGKAVQDTGRAVGKAGEDTANAVGKAHEDAARAIGKAHEDAAVATWKAAADTVDAAKAAARYTGRMVNVQLDAVRDADRRLREGKVFDALWHLGVDPLSGQEEAMAKAAQESSLIRTAGQVAAGVYGGPAGAAAFSAWYTYRTTGDAEMAFRVGVITGMTSAGFAAAGTLPTDTAGQLAAKTAITGAIGGLAVAASGGDAAAVREGFIRSGAMVLIQDGYKEFTTHELDPHAATEPPLETSALPDEAFQRDANGEFLRDQYGHRIVDPSKVCHGHSWVGQSSDAAPIDSLGSDHSPLMRSAAQIPGMNAMGLFHDQWVAAWDMNRAANVATIGPAIVLTYMGTDSGVVDLIREGALREAAARAAAQPKPLMEAMPAPPPRPKPKPAPERRERPDPPGANR